MPKEEICTDSACQEAADRAVKKVFAILGIDVDKPESVEEFREDLRFGKKLRKLADKSLFAFWGFAIGFAILWKLLGVVSNVAVFKAISEGN